MEHNANKRNSHRRADLHIPFGQTGLMIACKSVSFVEMVKWRAHSSARDEIGQNKPLFAKSDSDDEIRPGSFDDIFDESASDEDGQNATSFSKESSNAEIVAMIEQNLFLRAVDNGDTETVKTYLTATESHVEVVYRRAKTDILIKHPEYNCEQMEIHSIDDDHSEGPPPKRDNINRPVWLKAIAIAQRNLHYEMLNLLFNDQRVIRGLNEDGQTILRQVVAQYFATECDSRGLKPIKILLGANVLNLPNETLFEIVCKLKPKHCGKIYELLKVFFLNGIDLNQRNNNGETFLMLACKNKSVDVVRSLLLMASRGFVLDIDAVDNSGETALTKAKEKEFYEIVADLLEFKLISAVEDENADIVKSMRTEFRNTFDIFVKSWSSDQYHDDLSAIRKTKSDIWLEAMMLAIKNESRHSEELLKLLLECDILISQEIETGHLWFNKLMYGWVVDDDKKLLLFELLLKSGKINANDRDEHGRTALHWAEEEKLISLLISYGADVNKKDNEGKTPLMTISEKWARERFSVLRTILEGAGTLVNLDAVDCNGRTALMHAVMFNRSRDVEVLLNKGASVNVSDHLGFTALHHALHGNINEHFKFSQNSKELNKIKEMAILFDVENAEHFWRNEWSEDRRKIVEMLLQRPDIDVNLLSIETFSPLDIAEGQIPEIPSSIKDALKEKGAALNVFWQTESQSTGEFHLEFACMVTMELINKIENALTTENLYFLIQRWLALIETFKEKLASGKDQQGRTALHLVAISFCDFYLKDIYYLMVLANAIVDKLISLGCCVNEPDIFGCTPLHYANRVFWELFISKEACASIEDKDGNIAVDMTSRHVLPKFSQIFSVVNYPNEETYLLRLINNKQMEINVQCTDDSYDDRFRKFFLGQANLETATELLWKNGGYASRHPLAKKITEEVTCCMSAIAKEMERLDPRFAITIELGGSSNERTKIDEPDEFDFCFVLTTISELCEVSQSPELPTGFVRLKRKPTKVDKTSDFDSFFGNDEILNIEKLNWQFATILSKARLNIDSQLSYGWILKLLIKYTSISDNTDYNLKKVLTIRMKKPHNFFTVNMISVDIVPCIHIDGWWPDEAISNVSDEIKKIGCNLIFDSPQKLYPWVPYSESCARISFAKAESDMIKQSFSKAREAYMIGKNMAGNLFYVSKYILKNCLLYCIEALMPSSEKASQLGLSIEEMESKFHQMDRYLWLKCLLNCHLKFVAQDFCPCYFLPTFSNSSLGLRAHYLKKDSFDWIADHESDFPLSCKEACVLYRCASNDISESLYQLPAPDPLWERFDQKQLIASLCEIAYK